MGLFDDQVAMVQSASGSTVRLLRMAKHFSQYERSFTVWRAVIGILHMIRVLTWEMEEMADSFDTFCSQILKPFLTELGFDTNFNDSTHEKQCRHGG